MIDTVNKRRSVAAYSGNVCYPVADGAITAPDREHVAWLYAGIASGAPVVSTQHGAMWLGFGLRP